MGIVNIIALGIVIIFGGFGFATGFIKGSVRLVALIIALILAIELGSATSRFFQNIFHFSVETSNTISGIFLFLIMVITIFILGSILKRMIEVLDLTFLDRVLGFILGCFQSMILIFMLSLYIQLLPISETRQTIINNSQIVKWNNGIIARILEATKLDSRILNNEYYQSLLKYKLSD